MSSDGFIVLTGIVVIGVVWVVLMIGALAILMRATFPSGRPAPRARREAWPRHGRHVHVGPHPAGAAPPRPAHGATV